MIRWLWRSGGVLCVTVLAGCDLEQPTGLQGDLEVASQLSVQGEVEASDEHVFVFHRAGALPGGFAQSVTSAGGTVEVALDEIGVAVVSGLSDEAAASVARGGASVTRDVVVDWLPRLEDIEGALEALPEGFQPAGHDPTTAFFFPFQWNMQIIDADDAWNKGFRGMPGVRVAIIDTGIDPFHLDMLGLVDFGASMAWVPSLAPGPPWRDDHWHGTHVAGTVVTNGIGTSGVAPHVTLIAEKVFTPFAGAPFSRIIAAIVHATTVGRADVINMSLGGAFPKNIPGGGQLVAALNRAVNFADRNGVAVVSAAGNGNSDLDHNKNVILSPCESGVGLCVSATGPTDQKASYSNFGTSAADVAAPGGDFVVTFNPLTSTVLSPCSSGSVVIPSCQLGGFYLFAQGTSMATPHVSGTAALLDSQHGGALNGSQLRTALQRTADDLGKKGADRVYGKGRINVCRAVAC